ncbi:hypothetical protein Slin14017_G012030 [Septoria linicola]|nr:hypothetical protein Slin14017_G012030 [Septoria linicola]
MTARFDDLPSGLRTAQVLGLTATAALAGKTFGVSFAAVPALLHAPAPLLAKQWKTLYDSDKTLASVLSIFSSGVFAFLAYRDENWTKPAILYTTSSTLLLSLIPYTFLFSEPVNRKLQDKAQTLKAETSSEAGVKQEDTVHGLVDQWATINLGRFVVSAIAAGAAIWAAVDRTDIVPATARLATGANRMGN